MGERFPTPVTKSLLNTGGGSSFRILAGVALIAGGFFHTSVVKRIAGITRAAQ